MKSPTVPIEPAWHTVLLVCRQCGKRSSGPRSLKAKEVVKVLRQAARAEKPRPRVLLTGCLGLCPKKAMAIARIGGSRAARITAVESTQEAALALPLLTAP